MGQDIDRKIENRIKSLARGHTTNCIKVLAGLMNEESVPAAARISAANSILDRGWGRPAQTIVGDDDNPLRLVVVTGVPHPEISGDQPKIIDHEPSER